MSSIRVAHDGLSADRRGSNAQAMQVSGGKKADRRRSPKPVVFIRELLVPVGSYPTPFFGYLFFYIADPNHKIGV